MMQGAPDEYELYEQEGHREGYKYGNRRMRTMFAKRHYEAIATAMQETCPARFVSTDEPERRVQHAATVRALCDMFARDNPKFDRGRFERACVPGANVSARK